MGWDGAPRTLTAANSPYILSPDDNLICVDTTAGAVSLVAPDARLYPGGRSWTIKRIAGGNTVTITPAVGGQTFDGLSSLTLSVIRHAVTITADAVAALFHVEQWTPTFGTILGTPSSQANLAPMLIPTGVIVMWAGLLSAIPSGWVLCDGQNGTPDLRSRFVMGAAAAQDPGGTGGASTHTHTYTDVITHTHTVTVTDPGHTHGGRGINSGTAGTAGHQGASANNNANMTTSATQSATTGITATTVAPGGSVATGTTAAASTLPPFFALAYIQKT